MNIASCTRSCIRGSLALATLVFVLFVPILKGQSEDFDQYKIRLDGAWFYSKPTGSIRAEADTVPIDFTTDLNFSNYSTFAGKLDWKFTRKNHFYVVFIPLWISQTNTLSRDIVWDGQPIHSGSVVQSSLHSLEIAPGYQYDIIRRKRGHLGIAVQIDLFDITSAKISAAAQTTADGTHQAAVSASKSLLAPIPVAGPQFRYYLTNSPRVFIEGNVYGMYLFGYGNFVSTAGDIGVTLNKLITANAGYTLGSRLNVNGTSDRIALDLTQKGPLVGLELSF
ncbi:MAG: hypothetical protein WBQ61_12775 [Candidatus Acidiferrum sp.]